MRKQITTVVFSLFGAVLPIMVSAQVQSPNPPFTSPQPNPLEQRPRTVITKVPPRYTAMQMRAYKMQSGEDIKVTAEWKARNGDLIETEFLAGPTKEIGLYRVCHNNSKAIVCFGLGQRAIDVMRMVGYRVTVRVDDINTPFVLRRTGNTMTALENAKQATKLFTVYSDLWYKYTLPSMKTGKLVADFDDVERIFDILDMKFPEKWWWTTEEEVIDNRNLG